jgi:hypothetical protein
MPAVRVRKAVGGLLDAQSCRFDPTPTNTPSYQSFILAAVSDLEWTLML